MEYSVEYVFVENLNMHYRNIYNSDKNPSGDEIANVNFYAVRPEATQIRWNNAK